MVPSMEYLQKTINRQQTAERINICFARYLYHFSILAVICLYLASNAFFRIKKIVEWLFAIRFTSTKGDGFLICLYCVFRKWATEAWPKGIG